MSFRQAAALIAEAVLPHDNADKAREYLKRPWIEHPGNQLRHTPGTLRILDMILAVDALSDSEAISSAVKGLEKEICSRIAEACHTDGLAAFDEITGIRLSSIVNKTDYLVDFGDVKRIVVGDEMPHHAVPFDHAVTAGIRMESQGQEPTAGQIETPQGPANKKQAGIVEETLCECESRAAKTNEHFDRKNMPGQKIQFLELLQKLEPSFKGMTSTQSLDRYTKGRCKWSLRAKSNASATPLYQKLFPEAWGNPGAVSKDSGAS